MKRWIGIGSLVVALGVGLGCNPFAPAYDPDQLLGQNLLGDPTTIEGYFLMFKNAYELRDTTLYGQLFSQDFSFAYYDFEQGQEISWDRATEMRTTYRLFRNVQQIILDWNYYPPPDTTLTEAYVVRNFNLVVVEDAQTSFSGTGRARLRLRREAPGTPWRAYYWFDDSDF